jgi:thermostable 8-oxoguanine DNA glycosylase
MDLRLLVKKKPKIMPKEIPDTRFVLTSRSLKEAKRKYCSDKTYYIVDIGKIIRELGYDTDELSPESEFVINYAVQKKITQGIYSTRCNDILVVYKNISQRFAENLHHFLQEEMEEEFEFTIEVE